MADTASVIETLDVAIAIVIDVTGEDRVEEAVTDKGDHQLQNLADCVDRPVATSFSEPPVSGERRWEGKPPAHRAAFDAHHLHISSERGPALRQKRGAVVEHTFAHLCETGGSRRVTVRGLAQATRWYPLRAASHHLGLILRKLMGTGKPRGAFATMWTLWNPPGAPLEPLWRALHLVFRAPSTLWRANSQTQPDHPPPGRRLPTTLPLQFHPPNTPHFQRAGNLFAVRYCCFSILQPVFRHL